MSFLSKLGLRNWFKKTKQPKLTKSIANKSLSLECMEERIVPTVALFDNITGHSGGNVLHIIGTDLVDVVRLSLTPDGKTLTVTDTVSTGTNTPFGGTNDGTTYTLNFTTGIADKFAGIRVELLGDDDLLEISGGLDLRNITTTKGSTNTMQLEFYGNSGSIDDDIPINNTLAFLGNGGADLTIASKNDDIVYKNWLTIDNQDTNSKNAISIASVIGTSTFNYFKVAGYDTVKNNSRMINITSTSGDGPITFQVDTPTSLTAPAFLNFDTQLDLTTDLRIGYRQSNQIVNITSNAILYDPDAVNDPQISFSSPAGTAGNLYIQTQGSVNLHGIDLNNSNLIVSDTGNFTATGDVKANNIDFASGSNQNFQASFDQNVNVKNDFTIYSFGSGSSGSSISIGNNANTNTPSTTLPPPVSNSYSFNVGLSKVGSIGKFIVDPSLTLSITDPNNPFTPLINVIPTNGIYNLNVFSDTSTITTSATIKNTGTLAIGAPGRILLPPAPFPLTGGATFTIVNGALDASKDVRPDNKQYSATTLFGSITAATTITMYGNLNIAAATIEPFDRDFSITTQTGNLALANLGTDTYFDIIFGTVKNSIAGSNLTLSAGTVVNKNIPDANTLGLLNNIYIGGVNGPNRTLTIQQSAGFESNGSVRLKNLNLNSAGKSSNRGAGYYTFKQNIGTSVSNGGVTLSADTGFYNIDFQGTDNYFAGTTKISNYGKVILGVNQASQFNFAGGVTFSATLDNNVIYAPTVSGTGTLSGVVTLDGATLAPGSFYNSAGLLINIGILTFKDNVIFQDKFPTSSSDDNKAIYYVELLGNIPGVNQDQIVTEKFFVLVNAPILYPVLRNQTLVPGSQFTIVRQKGATPVYGKFSGLTNQSSNTYSDLNEGDTFFAAGAEYVISYRGGDGNDVVITFVGFATGGDQTYVFVDQNNVLNVIGGNGLSDVTIKMTKDTNDPITYLVISDTKYGLSGFAYGSKASGNVLTIPISEASAVGKGSFLGLKVEQNAGSDNLNLSNVSFQTIVLLDSTVDYGDPLPSNKSNQNLYTNTLLNPNISNVYFSFNGGPTAYPSKDVDNLNILGLNQNVQTGLINSSTVTIQGYDIVDSYDLTTFDESTGILLSASQGSDSFKIIGNIYIDKGTLTFGTINQSNVQSLNGNATGTINQLVPLTGGTITFGGDVFLSNGVILNLGDGKAATNLVIQSIKGTDGGLPSYINFNVLSTSQVYNGVNEDPNTTQTYVQSTINGGNIIVLGSLETDLGGINSAGKNFPGIIIENSGDVFFNGNVSASAINILNSDGNVNFLSVVGSETITSQQPDILITNVTLGHSVIFNDNLFANSVLSIGNASQSTYGLSFLGSITTINNNTDLSNTGGIVLGDSNDILNFFNGIQIQSQAPIATIYGQIFSKGAAISLNALSIRLTGDSSITSNKDVVNQPASISLSQVLSSGFTLTLSSGNVVSSTININQMRENGGKLIINSSGGVTINQVGFIGNPTGNPVLPSEIFGSVNIIDTVGDVIFAGPVLVNEIITTRQNYNVIFDGLPSNASYTSFDIFGSPLNNCWFYFVTGPNPTQFLNKGNVTFGTHGSDSQFDMDFFIFKGGVSTIEITGVTTLASRFYSANTDIVFGNSVISKDSFINTYFSSQMFNDANGPTFLNPVVDITGSFRANEQINAQVLNLFGYKSLQLNNTGFLQIPFEGYPRPLGDLPAVTGHISFTTVSNSESYLRINAGGLGIFGATIGGNVSIDNYAGGITDDKLGFYRGNNYTFINKLIANNLYFGVSANGDGSSTLVSYGVELFGGITIQNDFKVSNTFTVTPDVNNLLLLGSSNIISADSNIANSGIIQLGNQSTDNFSTTVSINVRGPAVRQLAGNFSAGNSKFLDFGPGPISLVADTIITTSGTGFTTLGQVNNNQFNLTVNGVAELQKFANDFALAPYPTLTNPASYIPVNNIVGSGTGPGNVTFNGIVKVQGDKISQLGTNTVINSGFDDTNGNGRASIGYVLAPQLVISGGGGRGASAVATLGLPIQGFNGIVDPVNNSVQFTRPFGTGFITGDRVTIQPGTRSVDASGNFVVTPTTITNPATAVITADSTTGEITGLTLTNTSAVLNGYKFAGSGYTDLTNLVIVQSPLLFAAIPTNVVGGIVAVTLSSGGSGYSSIPTISALSVIAGRTPTSAINGNVPPEPVILGSVILSSIPPGNVVTIPTTTTLRKQGTGSVFLNNKDSSSTTAGLVTTIENGNFFYENAKINAATITNVTGNGLLGGTKGTLGAVNILPRGQLSPGNLTNSIGVLNLQGNLSVQSTYKVDIRSVAFNLFDQVNVTGAVSLAKNNVNGILDVAFTPDADVIAGNTFGIISNDGTDAVTGTTTSTGTTYFKTPAGVVLNQGGTFTVNMPNGTDVATFQISYTGNIAANGTASLTGGNDVVVQITGIQSISSAAAAKSQNPNKLFAVSTDSGGGPIVKISFADGSGFSFFAYDTSFTGGVRTAIGDVNGDGTPDLITAAGPGGGPHVVIWTITPGVPYATVQSGFFAFEPGFTGGITLATGNINGDLSSSGKSLDDIIVGAGAGGGPRVKAFAGNASFAAINNQSQLVDFFAYAPEFNLGVNVAAGDRTSDGNDEIITGAAQGGGPHVQVWQISNGSANSIQSFFAFDPTFLCGVFVGSGDLDGDSLADIYTGTGSGPIGSVGIYFGNGAVSRLEPFGSGFTGGVRVGAALGGTNSPPNIPYLLTAAGPGGGPQVSLFDSNLNIVDAFFAFQENFTGGVLASTTVNT